MKLARSKLSFDRSIDCLVGRPMGGCGVTPIARSLRRLPYLPSSSWLVEHAQEDRATELARGAERIRPSTGLVAARTSRDERLRSLLALARRPEGPPSDRLGGEEVLCGSHRRRVVRVASRMFDGVLGVLAKGRLLRLEALEGVLDHAGHPAAPARHVEQSRNRDARHAGREGAGGRLGPHGAVEVPLTSGSLSTRSDQ